MDKRIAVEGRPSPRYPLMKFACWGWSEEAVDRMEEEYNAERVQYQSADGKRTWWVVRPKKVEAKKKLVRAKRCKTCLQMVRKLY